MKNVRFERISTTNVLFPPPALYHIKAATKILELVSLSFQARACESCVCVCMCVWIIIYWFLFHFVSTAAELVTAVVAMGYARKTVFDDHQIEYIIIYFPVDRSGRKKSNSNEHNNIIVLNDCFSRIINRNRSRRRWRVRNSFLVYLRSTTTTPTTPVVDSHWLWICDNYIYLLFCIVYRTFVQL
jgi:hypothetical protein